MTDSPNLSMTLMTAAQSQKHVLFNELLYAMDANVQLSVLDKDLTAPPGGPSEGVRYIPAATATGAWVGKEGKIAAYQNGDWVFYTPKDGWLCWVGDENVLYVYNSSAWVPYGLHSPNGAQMLLKFQEEEITLSGASTDSSMSFPNQSLGFAVAVRVTQLITASGGGSSFAVGDAGSTSRYGSGLGFSAGTTNQGIIGPTGYYGSNDKVRITANTGSFTGGKVRATMFYLQVTPPTS